ncbi:MAG TPA: hypothetical protein VNC78_01940 [Actinomycetota bacterium]|nr:hypothetical protein [Actinomycetota bacterium]
MLTHATDPSPPRSGGMAHTLVWCFGALIVAVAMGFAANILVADVLDEAIDPFTDGAIVPDPATALIFGFLVGGATGAVVGSRVRRGPSVAACVVIATYLYVWPMTFLSIRSGTWLTVSIVAHLVFAAGAARVMSAVKAREKLDLAASRSGS